jgi:hypothetical protein
VRVGEIGSDARAIANGRVENFGDEVLPPPFIGHLACPALELLDSLVARRVPSSPAWKEQQRRDRAAPHTAARLTKELLPHEQIGEDAGWRGRPALWESPVRIQCVCAAGERDETRASHHSLRESSIFKIDHEACHYAFDCGVHGECICEVVTIE